MPKLSAVTAALALGAFAATADALNNLKESWDAYVSPLVIPEVIDMTAGGSIEMQIGRAKHNWTADGSMSGDIYGYALRNSTPTFPGPTIKVAKGVPISVTWFNELSAPHLLDDSVESSLTIMESGCYPYCGVPVVVHVHGLESPAKYDGLPFRSIYKNQSQEMVYLNNQSAATKLYHDHANGLTRLNVWSGLFGMYVIEDKAREAAIKVDVETDIPLAIGDRLISNSGALMYSDDNCQGSSVTLWVLESFGTVNLSTVCNGHSWLATIGAFTLGMLIILLVEFIVHRVLEKNGHRHSHDALSPVNSKNLVSGDAAEKGDIESPAAELSHNALNSPATADTLSEDERAQKEEYKRAGMMSGIAIAIHNFPEGLALFVTSLQGLRAGIILSIGVILHNLPEGVAIAAPVYYATGSKLEAFKWTALSGIAQPLGAAIGWAAVSGGMSFSLQATLYAMVAGMLTCITLKELLPGAFRFDPKGSYFVSSFFCGILIIAFGIMLLQYSGTS
uniref:Plastocyanin-like domain-containing protein n=1 Tax=Globisporangium ultimum (strain ATCC 200006 / CBS 805.95 / DAOM BR144) TaxID=431595 RepID=K3WKJ5_GLOUD